MNRQKGFTLMRFKGFTLIELLITIAIIGLLAAFGLMSYPSVIKSARDSTRKKDLESIRSALEMYRADCNGYPANAPAEGSPLKGTNASASCALANVYLTAWPSDPVSSERSYSYTYTPSGNTYALCAALEKDPVPSMDTLLCGTCSTTGVSCNYVVVNP